MQCCRCTENKFYVRACIEPSVACLYINKIFPEKHLSVLDSSTGTRSWPEVSLAAPSVSKECQNTQCRGAIWGNPASSDCLAVMMTYEAVESSVPYKYFGKDLQHAMLGQSESFMTLPILIHPVICSYEGLPSSVKVLFLADTVLLYLHCADFPANWVAVSYQFLPYVDRFSSPDAKNPLPDTASRAMYCRALLRILRGICVQEHQIILFKFGLSMRTVMWLRHYDNLYRKTDEKPPRRTTARPPSAW